MESTWRLEKLPEIVATLRSRPRHEALRTLLSDIIRNAFGAPYSEFDHEVRMPEVSGRADMLFGATVFEFKSDLRHEIDDVLAKLPDYLREREGKTGRRYVGIATDGATFIAYQLRDGALLEFGRFETPANDSPALLAWLEPVVSKLGDLHPDPLTFRRELGRESLTYGGARIRLDDLWRELVDHPEVKVKRDLWHGLLREAYGAPVGDDGLFLQHTYLTIVAKTLAARVLDLPANDAEAILSGRALTDAGIYGAVESDFFDWVLLRPDGRDLVDRIARQVSRFRLRDVDTDVLKALYESLIDPAQRRDLGEYYTPDWLAAKIVAEAVPEPLTLRVLDPACGSGTFLFHALRRLLAAAREAGHPDALTLQRAAGQVRGLDIHPIAVIIARVTWLLALADAIGERDQPLHVPVYLGDALQWSLVLTMDSSEVMLPVPDEGPLHIPAGIAEHQDRFEPALREVTEGLAADTPRSTVERALVRIEGVAAADAQVLADTYARILALKAAGRDGIWPFILRNLIRPVWLSRPEQQADVLIGNPPWVAYRHLSAEMKPRLREASQRMNLWVGGVLATQQDLSGLFFARAVERYLRVGGRVAFVMPYAVLNRPAFHGIRAGEYATAKLRIDNAWSLELVRPLFPTSACVLFGLRADPAPLPSQVERFEGVLPRRDEDEANADQVLSRQQSVWPPITTLEGASPYRDRFRQGANIVPRRFFLVETDEAGRLGANRATPRVRGRVGPLDKRPWTTVQPPAGPIEARFLKPLLMGEGVAPYRLLGTALAVIPVEAVHVLNAQSAADLGARHLASWLRHCEAAWSQKASKKNDGSLRITLLQQIDHMRKLSLQLRTVGPRIAYIASGTLMSAAILEDPSIVVEHAAYWSSVSSIEEGRYLCAVINTETSLSRIIPMQARGWRDPRHFDKLIWELPIAEFDPANDLHGQLAHAAAEAERLAAEVPLPTGHFTAKRRAIRAALAAAGISQRIDALVATLLDA